MGRHERLITKLSTKGQVIVPKEIRDLLRWKPGTRLSVKRTEDGVLLKAEPIFPPTKIEDVVGCLKYDGPTISIEEMNESIVREARRRAGN